MTVILLRHGRSVANVRAQLAGRTPGIGLDDLGRAQADAIVERLGPSLDRVVAVVRSPLQRCAETVVPLLASVDVPEVVVDDLIEVDYGDWTNQPIKQLLTEPLWKTVQQQPSAAVFPGGEGLAQVQHRAVAAIRRLDAHYGGPDGQGVWVACTHGDVIKSIVADALGMHLDSFQRIVVEPASMSVISYHPKRPTVHAVNSTQTVPVPPARKPDAAEHAADSIGGSTGSSGTIDVAKEPTEV